jgi:hypothetical protein
MDLFTSSAFYPGYCARKSKLGVCLDTLCPVFSRDLGEGGAKTFFACGYELFCTRLYRKPALRNVYEVLQFHKPTKVYFDFDYYLTSDEGREQALVWFELTMFHFLDHVKALLAERFGLLPTEIKLYILDASSMSKLSSHVIVDIVLANVPAVKAFFDHALSTFPDEAAIRRIVDPLVYTRNRSFRLIYSTKMGKANPLLLRGAREDAYNPQHVFDTLIQAVVPRHYAGPLASEPHVVRAFVSDTPNKRRRVNENEIPNASHVDLDEEDCPVGAGLKSYLSDLGGIVRSASQNGPFLSLIVSGTVCPWVGKLHKNNNAFYTVNTKTWVGWFKCSDGDCPRAHYLKSSLHWALKR